jgi:hypothetical protein
MQLTKCAAAVVGIYGWKPAPIMAVYEVRSIRRGPHVLTGMCLATAPKDYHCIIDLGKHEYRRRIR